MASIDKRNKTSACPIIPSSYLPTIPYLPVTLFTMPYNTRRKSLSLPSLGIHVPSSNPRRANNNHNHSHTASMPSPRSASESSSAEHPNKKAKRSHTPTIKFDHTPPPSPGVQHSIEKDETGSAEARKIDMKGINDEIVEAVIVRLQESGNRPHLVKELSTVLIDQVKIVQQ